MTHRQTARALFLSVKLCVCACVSAGTLTGTEGRLGTVAGAGAWLWGGPAACAPHQRESRWGSGFGWARTQRPWGPSGGSGERCSRMASGGMRCSLRLWVLLASLALLFLTSLLFSLSLRGGPGLSYLESPGWEESRKVKLVPNYASSHKLVSAEGSQQKTCACKRCVGDPSVSDWFDENYEPDISPVWTRDNIQLPSDVYYWWVVSKRISTQWFIYFVVSMCIRPTQLYG